MKVESAKMQKWKVATSSVGEEEGNGFARICKLIPLIFLLAVSICAGEVKKPKVTFVELGSVNCIPCKAMKKVMDSLEVKYPKDLRIVFHDVWTDDGKPAARKFGIRSIPTQVFLDSNGVEYFRHEGYFPMIELEKILKQKQVSK